jgi:hypothetical protein
VSVVGFGLLITGCHCLWLLLTPGCRMSVVSCWLLIASASLSLFVVSSLLSDVGCRFLVVDCLVSLSLVVVSSWLSVVGCRVLVVDCLVSLSLFVVSSWLSGCW